MSKRFSTDKPNDWVGLSDKNLFPAGILEPQYLFLRPFNAVENNYDELLLKEWIMKNHLEYAPLSTCTKNDLGSRDECLRQIISDHPQHIINEDMIMVPVDAQTINLAKNLKCSLQRHGMTNFIFWALDKPTGEKLLAAGHLVYMDKRTRKRFDTLQMTQEKPRIIQKLITAGFNVWYFDPDVIIQGNIKSRVIEYKQPPHEADIIFSVTGPIIEKHLKKPSIGTGLIYFKNSEKTKRFIKKVIEEIDRMNTDDKKAYEMVVGMSICKISGVGSKGLQEKFDYEVIKEEVVILDGLEDDVVAVHFFDQFEFIDGSIYFDDPGLIPEGFRSFKAIHANVDAEGGFKIAEEQFKERNLWYIDEEGNC
jgi:hypothetical protein